MANTTCCDQPLGISVRLSRQGGLPFVDLGNLREGVFPVYPLPNPEAPGVYALVVVNYAELDRDECIVVVPDSGVAVGYSVQVQDCDPADLVSPTDG